MYPPIGCSGARASWTYQRCQSRRNGGLRTLLDFVAAINPSVTGTAAIEDYRMREELGVPEVLELSRACTYRQPHRNNGLLDSKATPPPRNPIGAGHPRRICRRTRQCRMGIEVFVSGLRMEVVESSPLPSSRLAPVLLRAAGRCERQWPTSLRSRATWTVPPSRL